MNELFGEGYYIAEVNKGSYSAIQITEIRKKAIINKWDKLRGHIDAECGARTCPTGSSGKGHSISQNVVKVGKYTIGEDKYNSLKMWHGEVTEDELGEQQKMFADIIEGKKLGKVKLLANEFAVSVRSVKYDRSICIYQKGQVGSKYFLVHNWGLNRFTAAIEDEWRNLSMDDEVNTTATGPGGNCFASVNIKEFETVIKLLSGAK